MLLISRKLAESFQIGTDIQITVQRIGRSKVQIGITAPRQIPVVRTELIERAERHEVTPITNRQVDALPGPISPSTSELVASLEQYTRMVQQNRLIAGQEPDLARACRTSRLLAAQP
jgi:carbon storage regulator